MNNTTYTPEQLAFAERISRALSNVPKDKRSTLESIVEVLLVGASIAAQPACGAGFDLDLQHRISGPEFVIGL